MNINQEILLCDYLGQLIKVLERVLPANEIELSRIRDRVLEIEQSLIDKKGNG